MSTNVTFTIDGKEITGTAGQTILEAAEANGVYIPRLCHKPGLTPHGSCRVCSVYVNGRPMGACHSPIAEGMAVENDTERVLNMRRDIIDMLFVEGNHFCMFCEKSGNCELQAMAYRFGITAPKYPYMFPKRDIDMSHPDIWIDHNRCILCARCVRTSQEKDGKHVFDFVERGGMKRIAVNGDALADTDASVADEAINACPVGALMKKRVGYVVPVGQRRYDHQPIGITVEQSSKETANA
jgi:[NiFe] hydrogenase diaphorase moiety small subunit